MALEAFDKNKSEQKNYCISCGTELKKYKILIAIHLLFCDNKDCPRFGFFTAVSNFFKKEKP